MGGSMTENPGEKQCVKCGTVVMPDWHAVSLSEETGYLGASRCTSCGNVMFHTSGSPWFVHVVQEYIKEGKRKGEIK